MGDRIVWFLLWCDAFENEFGHTDENHCEEHYYDHEGGIDCPQCAKASELYRERLVTFGRSYLEDLLTQEEAESKAAECIEWDYDAKEMLQWVKDNALSNSVPKDEAKK